MRVKYVCDNEWSYFWSMLFDKTILYIYRVKETRKYIIIIYMVGYPQSYTFKYNYSKSLSICYFCIISFEGNMYIYIFLCNIISICIRIVVYIKVSYKLYG